MIHQWSTGGTSSTAMQRGKIVHRSNRRRNQHSSLLLLLLLGLFRLMLLQLLLLLLRLLLGKVIHTLQMLIGAAWRHHHLVIK